jgi:hypothetical protein
MACKQAKTCCVTKIKKVKSNKLRLRMVEKNFDELCWYMRNRMQNPRIMIIKIKLFKIINNIKDPKFTSPGIIQPYWLFPLIQSKPEMLSSRLNFKLIMVLQRTSCSNRRTRNELLWLLTSCSIVISDEWKFEKAMEAELMVCIMMGQTNEDVLLQLGLDVRLHIFTIKSLKVKWEIKNMNEIIQLKWG